MGALTRKLVRPDRGVQTPPASRSKLFFGRCFGCIEVIGVGAGGEVFPPAIAHDEHDDA